MGFNSQFAAVLSFYKLTEYGFQKTNCPSRIRGKAFKLFQFSSGCACFAFL